ncbi:MAG TPA: Ldh family oxidoreductase [Firmicutes bacterium]|nr:Ldh family oxidoreductase [Bacillota bacterium]
MMQNTNTAKAAKAFHNDGAANDDKVVIEPGRLKAFAVECLKRAGMREADAEVVADSLIFADLRKVSSHGIARLPIYMKRLQLGLVSPSPEIRVVSERGNVAVLDGGNGPGQVIAKAAMEKAMSIAGQRGIGACGVRNSNHCGALAYYSMMAIGRDMIGIAMTNANPTMAPWGGSTAMLGTNPISMAVPAGEELPVVMDMATSAVARGKVILAAKEGKEIPLGWGINEHGEPTQDPREALKGALVPLGGAKGYALALMVDVLSGVLTGARCGTHVGALYDNLKEPQGAGHFMCAVNISDFMDPVAFKARMDEVIRELKAAKPARGVDRVYLPGELEFMAEKERRQNGIPLDRAVFEELKATGDGVGVEIDL